MKRTLPILVSLCLCVAPFAASASTYVYSSTESSSDTGGNTVSPGGTVETGASYSSVSSENDIENGTGTSTVEIQTDDNGQVQSQSITKPIIPGVPVEISVATSTGNGGTQVEIRTIADQGAPGLVKIKHDSSGPSGTSTASSSFTTAAFVAAPGLGMWQSFWHSFLRVFDFI